MIAQQIVFPQQNYGWLEVKLAPGEYSFYIQFKDGTPAQHGFETVTMSVYGVQECLDLEEGECKELKDESAFTALAAKQAKEKAAADKAKAAAAAAKQAADKGKEIMAKEVQAK